VLCIEDRVATAIEEKEGTDMFSLLRPVAIASAVGLTAAATFVLPASAAPAGTNSAALVTGTAPEPLPNVNIAGKPTAWSPSTLSVARKAYTNCTVKKEVFTITNETTHKAIITDTYKGTTYAFGTLGAGEKAGVCTKAAVGSVSVFHLKASKSTLSLTAT
jgi:hypothetical protein